LQDRSNLTEEQARVALERRKLQIEIQAAREREKVLQAQFGDNSLEVQLIREQIKLIEAEYAKVGEVDVSAFQALKNKILQALGITEEQAQLLLGQAGDAIGAITGLVDASLQLQIGQQDKLIDAIRGRIGEAEKLLADEQKRAEKGYANNARALEESLRKEQEALKAAEEERAELQAQSVKRQARQNQIAAISEYGLLVIRLLSDSVAKAGVVGIGIALGGIALIAKIIAEQKKAAASITGFREGIEWVQGPGTGTSDSVPAMLSRGERVLPYELNQDVGGRSVSNDELVRLFKLGRAFEGMTGSMAPFLAAASQGERERQELETSLNYEAMAGAYRTAAMEASGEVVKAIKGQPVVIPMEGVTVVEQGKSRRVYRGK